MLNLSIQLVYNIILIANCKPQNKCAQIVNNDNNSNDDNGSDDDDDDEKRSFVQKPRHFTKLK